jgi:uncharacterized protein YneF (UPF0154 family)
MTLGLFLIRRYMMKHMEKHQRYLEEQKKENSRDANKK